MNNIVTLAFTTKILQLQFLSDWQHENEAFQDQNVSLKIYFHHPVYYVPLPKNLKKLIYGSKVIEGPEAPEDLY